ncbi:hypothetical protein NIES2104_47160 [Leptolyngbya sp. NIES-2104]|nr:hypothetical protein NIES2104_47160 [Leptolyngbya sp. NIES-2104]
MVQQIEVRSPFCGNLRSRPHDSISLSVSPIQRQLVDVNPVLSLP